VDLLGLLPRLKATSISALRRMYVPTERIFVYRLKREGSAVVAQGRSARYTAISLLGLGKELCEEARHVLQGADTGVLSDVLTKLVLPKDNVGDIALAMLVAHLMERDLDVLRERLLNLQPVARPVSTVELSWVLMASCIDARLVESGFAQQVAQRLLSSFVASSGVFAHIVGDNVRGPRAHVSCFADFVYPLQSLAIFHRITGDRVAFDAAVRCSEQMVRMQGPDGQWWWHFDCRTGEVIERYPVYSVHQHGMAPMALFALEDAGGPTYHPAIVKSLEWLAHAPEIGHSLIDDQFDVIWRKVARREPRKLARRLQAGVSYIHPAARIGGIDRVMPPRAIDYECRPYELGWLLYAWTDDRLKQLCASP
jgi:hypothetical protein